MSDDTRLSMLSDLLRILDREKREEVNAEAASRAEEVANLYHRLHDAQEEVKWYRGEFDSIRKVVSEAAGIGIDNLGRDEMEAAIGRLASDSWCFDILRDALKIADEEDAEAAAKTLMESWTVVSSAISEATGIGDDATAEEMVGAIKGLRRQADAMAERLRTFEQ